MPTNQPFPPGNMPRERPPHTPAGDRWRQRLRRWDGTLSPRTLDVEVEQGFWRNRMASGAPGPDPYASAVYQQVRHLAAEANVQSVLEIGPGWGNYTFPLCRDFPLVTCVDISPENLAYLSAQASRPPETICSPWEWATVPRRDLVFGYNCFYRMAEPEWFLAKIHQTANKLCVIGMNRPPELPWLPDLEKAGLPVHYTRQGCRELAEVLLSLGIRAKLVDIPNQRLYLWQSEEALLHHTQTFLPKPCDRDALRQRILPHCEIRPDGSLICRHHFLSQLLVWEPKQP